MRRIVFTFISCLFALTMAAQHKDAAKDSTIFKGYIYNKEYNVYIQMDFYHNNVVVPFQEIFGPLPGFFGDRQDGRKWLFTNAEVKGKTATLQITNDYGSEDLTATLTYNPADSTFTLEQGKGSNIKIAVNRKFVKIPQKLEFKRQR